ncbi:resolvase [Bacillus pseudomycoides]|uniref:Resolvase n=1 Tax=Bacillus pseudomycoides TaxID=64104 RepID=A0AA91VDV2_9BACI|nr:MULTISPECIES: recombinase family protein [Bacillus]PEB56980.1 resolvase [Bacillus sp. AFS098217]PED83400.1 resolvase [Bacillus pseudomycoides]PEU14942.1 resolvase [Bacillus sp. AFS014408]PEU15344.1 resolvase [Bacillus sp. AFS019443]PFW61088.1 resolvase [Bacillus sp. AFS075034]
MKYGYARVSTLQQDLESQIQILEKEGCEEIYSEKFTGTSVDRPQFQELLSKLEPRDTLVVTKLDRLARNTKEGITIIEELFEKKVRVHVLNVGLMEDTTMGNFFLQTLLAVAEMERNLIVERTQEGKAIAKQREDFKEGRPKKYNKKQIAHALQLLETNSYKQVEEITGISKSTLIRAVREKKKVLFNKTC